MKIVIIESKVPLKKDDLVREEKELAERFGCKVIVVTPEFNASTIRIID